MIFKPRNIFFVGGIHGVGKTVLCKRVSLENQLVHHSCSDLIKSISDIDHQSDKKVSNVDQNQDNLVEAINHILDPDGYYLLDGHFCLIDQNKQITRIPKSTVWAISPHAIIVLKDRAERICDRIKRRDDNLHDVSFIKLFQEEELKYSREVAETLCVPYLEANPFDDQDKVSSFLKSFIDNGLHTEEMHV